MQDSLFAFPNTFQRCLRLTMRAEQFHSPTVFLCLSKFETKSKTYII